MIPIQEVDVYSDNGIKISAHVVVPNLQKGISGAEVMIYDPTFSALYSTYYTIGRRADPEAAVQAIVEFSNKYIEKAGGKVTRINNPSNTEFADAGAQQNVVNALLLGVTVESNA